VFYPNATTAGIEEINCFFPFSFFPYCLPFYPFLVPAALSLESRIQTLDLRLMSRVFYPCAATTVSSSFKIFAILSFLVLELSNGANRIQTLLS
jgi:hypothetical protein